jgi:hypothetical protein
MMDFRSVCHRIDFVDATRDARFTGQPAGSVSLRVWQPPAVS